ncbi:MAG: hypothetical protein GX366_09005 [Epulopiscium sp.]|nr:hypothetical protein [Candidatus Epulonipiscium sp.]
MNVGKLVLSCVSFLILAWDFAMVSLKKKNYCERTYIVPLLILLSMMFQLVDSVSNIVLWSLGIHASLFLITSVYIYNTKKRIYQIFNININDENEDMIKKIIKDVVGEDNILLEKILLIKGQGGYKIEFNDCLDITIKKTLKGVNNFIKSNGKSDFESILWTLICIMMLVACLIIISS